MPNNNLLPSSVARCRCGRYASIGEDVAGLTLFGYECPDCSFRKYSKPLTSEEFYNQFDRINSLKSSNNEKEST